MFAELIEVADSEDEPQTPPTRSQWSWQCFKPTRKKSENVRGCNQDLLTLEDSLCQLLPYLLGSLLAARSSAGPAQIASGTTHCKLCTTY